jgi:uncharacterized membrane protein YdbT with pleckstrin-like domain
MGSGSIEFRSKIGFVIVIPAVIVLLFGGVSTARAIAAGRIGMAVVLALPIALVAWIALTTRYTLTDEHLEIRITSAVSRIPLAAIRRVRPTRTVLSAPALSLDRLEITHDGGIAVISPNKRELFLAEIRARCPAADVYVV